MGEFPDFHLFPIYSVLLKIRTPKNPDFCSFIKHNFSLKSGLLDFCKNDFFKKSGLAPKIATHASPDSKQSTVYDFRSFAENWLSDDGYSKFKKSYIL